MNIEEVELNSGYTFKDKKLLVRALTHSSADNIDNNECLEFLGDAILEFIVSEKIYSERSTEGKLTELRAALVKDEALEPVSRTLGLDKNLNAAQGNGKAKKPVPSAYEALVAAIYLDGGLDEARQFVLRTLDFGKGIERDPKTLLQEYLQANMPEEKLPDYKKSTVDTGTETNPKFKTVITVAGRNFEGESDNKQQAQKSAAKSALEYLNSKK